MWLNTLYITRMKNLLQYMQMTVFNLYNLCGIPGNVACRDYSHLHEYLIKIATTTNANHYNGLFLTGLAT